MIVFSPPRILILGGYGVFGSLIAKELLDIPLTIAGRDGAKAARFAATLGPNARGIALNIRNLGACLKAFEGHDAVVHCAGPFAGQDGTVLEACAETKCHYIDIADDRGYTEQVRSFHDRFERRGLTAAYGCSSLPGISGALASVLQSRSQENPTRIRVTLFIGNRNPKGEAAVGSVFRILGKFIKAPQGPIPGFGDPETVALPAPWGPRTVFNFSSPEYDLFPQAFGAKNVTVKIGFELGLIGRGFRFLARFPEFIRAACLGPLVRIGNTLSFFGSSGGAVAVEFFFADGSSQMEAVSSPTNGQKMAILPGVFVVRKLLSEGSPAPGSKTASEVLGAELLISNLRS